MENKPEPSGREILKQLAEACDRQLEALQETRKMHENLFGPLDTEPGEESDSLLRLRKVYCHVIAITSWRIDRWVFHVMAPDIRAALEQLRPLVRETCKEVHEPKEQCKVSRYFDKLDDLLTPLTHPTTVNLTYLPEANGAFAGGGVKHFSNLCLSLHCLLAHYALTLDIEASRLGLSPERLGNTIVERAAPRVELVLAGEYMATKYEPLRIED